MPRALHRHETRFSEVKLEQLVEVANGGWDWPRQPVPLQLQLCQVLDIPNPFRDGAIEEIGFKVQ